MHFGVALLFTTDDAPAAEWQPTSASEHGVMFYEDEAFLLDSLVGYLRPALCVGERVIVVASSEHRAGLERRLTAMGIDLRAARISGAYVDADARETLARFMIDDAPDPERFAVVLDELFDGVTPDQPARVFGEMVALLVGDGHPEAALALERLWNLEAERHAFALLCGYPIRAFGGEALAAAMETTCRLHSGVMPAESYSALDGAADRLREIARLQQQAASLERALASEREARAAAESALRARDEFLSTASHELRTPITVLGVQAQVMLRRWARSHHVEPEDALQALNRIQGQADKLARLVNQLLDVSRMDSGKLPVQAEPTDLASVLRQVVEMVSAISDQHPISLSAPEAVWLEVDPLRLEQVLMNLLDNAIKYTPEGSAIEVTLAQTDAGCVEIGVRDHGPGIDPDKRAQIFDRFYQVDRESSRWGMGLGLYLCRHIVEQHGGALDAEFPDDGGTRFVIRLRR